MIVDLLVFVLYYVRFKMEVGFEFVGIVLVDVRVVNYYFGFRVFFWF